MDVRTLQADRSKPSSVHDERRLTGVARPSSGCNAVLGDVAGPEWVSLGGVTPDATRGTPVEVIGAWDEPTGSFVCRSSSALCQLPDYGLVCAAVDRLCEHWGLDGPPMLLRLAGRADLHPSVAVARAQRRIGEWERVLAAAEVLDCAQAAGPLTLDALAAVQQLVVPLSTPRAGQLRQTPALIRWGGVVTFRAPPVADARRRTANFLAAMSDRLDDQGPTSKPGDSLRANDHPAYLAAEAVTSITDNHPFADGNGRTARAVATWLLLRAGFRQRDAGTLSTVLDDHLDEHFAALRYHRASPWAWHQLFADTVLASFERPVTANSGP